jgi:hypothetical protein
VEPPRRQSECDREDGQLVCEGEDLGWQLPLLCTIVFGMYVYRATDALIGYFSH